MFIPVPLSDKDIQALTPTNGHFPPKRKWSVVA